MDGLLNTLKFAHKVLADIMKFVVAVQNWFVRFGNCVIIDLYSSYGL
jgi:hypothetical protein